MGGIYASLRQAQILILEILNVFLWLHEVKRQRYIIAFLELEQKSAFFKGLVIRINIEYITKKG